MAQGKKEEVEQMKAGCCINKGANNSAYRKNECDGESVAGKLIQLPNLPSALFLRVKHLKTT